jgi:hypothetical protein
MAPPPHQRDRPRASVIGSLLQGWSRALHAPWVAGGLLLATTVFTWLNPRISEIRAEAEIVTSQFDEVARTLVRTLALETSDLGALLNFGVGWLRGASVRPTLLAYAATYFALWLFLSGGIVDRLARGRPMGAGMFSWASGYYLGRFLRLGLFVGPIYWALVRWLYPFLRETSLGDSLQMLLFVVIVSAVDVIVSFTSIRLVIEDRRSVLAALVAALRFIRRRFIRVGLLWLANMSILAIVMTALVSSSPWTPRTMMVLSTLYLLTRIWLRLAVIGSEIAFFQGELAHAHYTAGPPRIWPESPAVEAIENLTRIAQLSGGRRDTKDRS